MNYGYSIDDSDIGRDQRTGSAALPWADTLSSTLENAWVHNPTTEIGDLSNEFFAAQPWARAPAQAVSAVFSGVPVIGPAFQAMGLTAAAQPGGAADQFVDPKTLNKLYGQSLGLSFDTPQRKGAVDILVAAKREQRQRDYILAHGPQGFSARSANFLTTLAVSAADPLNIAAAFVPVVGEARAALWTERYGATVSRFAQGAISGGSVTAAYQPLEALRDHVFQEQYGPLDAFMNVAFGTLLGGGLHAGLGKLSDFLGGLHPETREAALTSAVAQSAEGRSVDVSAVMASDPAARVEPTFARPAASAPLGPSAADLETALADVKISRAAAPREPSLLDAIHAAGGLKTRDVAGNRLQDAGNIEEAFRNYKRPGLINNKTGKNLDMMREHLTEQGWLNNGNRDVGLTDLNDLLDHMRTEAQGQKVYHPESTIHGELAYRELLDREFSEAGIASTDAPKGAAQKLAEYRQSQSAAMLAEHEQAQIDHLLLDLSPNSQEALQSHGYEPGSDIGAEFETGDGTQGGVAGRQPQFGGQGNAATGTRQANGSGQVSQEFTSALDRTRSASTDFTRGQEPSPASSPEASKAADEIVRLKEGDDIDAEYQAALAQVADYERQGILTKAEADAARSGSEDIAKANSDSKAAQAAARCLLLHP